MSSIKGSGQHIPLSLQKIFVKHYKAGRSTYDIAQQYATSHETVRNHLLANGVTMRPRFALSPAKKRSRRALVSAS